MYWGCWLKISTALKMAMSSKLLGEKIKNTVVRYGIFCDLHIRYNTIPTPTCRCLALQYVLFCDNVSKYHRYDKVIFVEWPM